MKKLYILFSLFLGFAFTSKAQTVADALRYGNFDIVSTARAVGVGGSMSGIGVDFSVLSQNPAGLAAFRRSEFVVTPAFYSNNAIAQLQGNGSFKESQNKFVLSNLGFVMASRPRGSKWQASNVAIGINRIGDYNREFFFEGRTRGSITDRWLELADGLSADQLGGFEEGLANSTGAIYDFDEDGIWESDYAQNPEHLLYKQQFGETTGGNTELLFSYGANYDEKLLLGFSVGVPIVSYESTKSYVEEDESSDEVPFFNSLEYEEFLTTSGAGFNFKFGLLYKITKFVNFGFAVHTPTWLSLTDDYFATLTYDYTDSENDGPLVDSSPDGNFRYKLNTPWSVIGSFGAVLNKAGFVTAEIQWTDYSTAEFDYTSRGNGSAFMDQEREINGQIRNQLGSAIQFKFGGELALDNFGIRAGIGLHQNPYADSDQFDVSYSGGIGFKASDLYLYLGYQFRSVDEEYNPYFTGTAPQPTVDIENRSNRFLLTFRYQY